jgi:hypothetical protein
MLCMRRGGSFYFLSVAGTSSMMMEGKLRIAVLHGFPGKSEDFSPLETPEIRNRALKSKRRIVKFPVIL